MSEVIPHSFFIKCLNSIDKIIKICYNVISRMKVVKKLGLDISKSLSYKLQILRNNLLQGETLYSFAKRHDYCSTAINLLENNIISLETSLELIAQANNTRFQHQRDNRNIYEFNLNLIAGWIVEDFIVDNSNGLLKLNGCDKNRTICREEKITNQADLITYNGVPIEVHTEYFSRYKLEHRDNCIRLRDNKYMNLLKEDAYILAINIPNRTYLLKKVSDFSIKSVFENPDYNGKIVYDLYIENISNKFRPLQELFNRFNNPKKLCNTKVLSA